MAVNEKDLQLNKHSSLLLFFSKIRGGKDRYSKDKLATHLFSYLDPNSFCHVSMLNKQMYKLSTLKETLPKQVLEKIIIGRYDRYTIKKTIDRKMIQEILKQTGFEIVINPGNEVLDNYVIAHGLGSGGAIYLGHSQTKGYVAIKITQGDESITREVALHKALQNLKVSHILPIIDQQQVKLQNGTVILYQVLNLAGLGSMDKLKRSIQQIADPKFREQLIFCIAEGLLCGLTEMHRAGYCHLDMKPDNLMASQDGSVFLIDFGCSAIMQNKNIQVRKERVADSYYYSPDRWISENPAFSDICDGEKLDAWAAGLTLLELADTTEFPFMDMMNSSHGSNLSQVKQRLLKFYQNKIALISVLQNPPADSCWSLVHQLLAFDPNDRITPLQALEHPWFKKMAASKAKWSSNTKEHLRELVQTLLRNQRFESKHLSEPMALSPSELPFSHFSTFIERPTLQETINKYLLTQSSETSSQLVLQGMGGIGKTQLTSYVVNQKIIESTFGMRLWFRSSDNTDLLATQCIVLARELGLVSEQSQIKEVLEKLHTYLSGYKARTGKPWLAIFDNADNPEVLKPFLPPKGGKIIITSRTTRWENMLSIDVLTELEGHSLVCKLLEKEEPKAKELCQELGYLPLGIVQACAFLRNQQTSDSSNISTYIQQLQKTTSLLDKNEQLFGKKLPGSIHGLWQLTLQTLSITNPESVNLLDILAYLSPDNIPKILLNSLGSIQAQNTLQKFSLLRKEERDTVSIHRLLQLAIRSMHSAEKFTQCIVFIMEALAKISDPDPKSLPERQLNIELLAHGEIICNHYEKINKPSKKIQQLYCNTLCWLAEMQGEIAQPYKRKEILEKVLKIVEQCFDDNQGEIASVLNRTGRAWESIGDFKKAKEFQERALAISQKIYGPSHPKTAMYLNSLGLSCRNLGDPKTALEFYKQALDINEQHFGKHHTILAIDLGCMGIALLDLNDNKQAQVCFDRALKISENTHGPDHVTVAFYLHGLGGVSRNLHQLIDSKNYLVRSLNIMEKLYGPKHPQVARYLNSLGTTLRLSGQPTISISYHERALAINESTFGPDHPNALLDLANIGLAYQNLGEFKKALECLERAYNTALKHSSLGASHFFTIKFKQQLDSILNKKLESELNPKISQDSNSTSKLSP